MRNFNQKLIRIVADSILINISLIIGIVLNVIVNLFLTNKLTITGSLFLQETDNILTTSMLLYRALHPVPTFLLPEVFEKPAWSPTKTLLFHELYLVDQKLSAAPAPLPRKTEYPVFKTSICPFCVIRAFTILFVRISRSTESCISKF